jgi:hypothetical protein
MVSSFVGEAFNQFDGGTPQTPAATQIDDLVLVIIRGNSTAPVGWVLEGRFTSAFFNTPLEVWSRISTANGAYSTPGWSSASTNTYTIVVYRDTPGVATIAANENTSTATSHTAPTVSLTSPERVVSAWGMDDVSGLTADSASTKRSNGSSAHPMVYDKVGGPGLVTGTILTTSTAHRWRAVSIGLAPSNTAPNAPTLTSMTGSVTINRAAINRASHTFSDNDAADSQSQFNHYHRLVGAPTWTTITQVTPNQFYDFPASYFAAGNYERQVETYDSLGVLGARSSSSFFTAADAPAGPTITYPTNGQSVEQFETVTWSTPNQDSYQVRRVADLAGAPDGTTIYYDSGEIASSARSLALEFETNNRTEHVQVRSKFGGLWSEWASVAISVATTSPPTPQREIQPDPASGSLLVVIGNPAPSGGDPAAVHNDVYVNDGDGEERRATLQATNATWRYWTPKSGRDYTTGSIRIVAVAANGSTASSA